MRGAVLFGDKHASSFQTDTFTPAGGVAVTTTSSYYSDHLGVIGVGEAELGVEYALRVGRGSDLFVRAGIEGQLWIGGGSATSESGQLGFFGYTFTVGVNYQGKGEKAEPRP